MKVLSPFGLLQLKYIYYAIEIFSLMVVVLVFFIFFILAYKNRVFNTRRKIKSILEEWLMEIILEENVDFNKPLNIPVNIKYLLRKKLAKKVLLHELVKLKKSLSGIPGDNVQKLYEQFHLDALSRQRIGSARWHFKVKGIQDMAIMNQHSESLAILNLTNFKHSIVRMEAQTALVRLQKYKGLNFLNNLTYPLTEWHQVNLLRLLSHQPIASVHGISIWLQSCNASVVQFTLKLIGEQHAEEFCEEVVNLLYDNNINVRRCAILCLGEILSDRAVEGLKKHFPKEKSKELKMCIISQLEKADAQSTFKFFIDMQLDKDADIKLVSHNIILNLIKDKRSILAA